MSGDIENVLRNLLHPSISMRKKGFVEFSDMFIKSLQLPGNEQWKDLREYLWKAIEYEEDVTNQRKLMRFALDQLEDKAVNKLLRYTENRIINSKNYQTLGAGIIKFGNASNYQAIQKLVSRSGIKSMSFLKSMVKYFLKDTKSICSSIIKDLSNESFRNLDNVLLKILEIKLDALDDRAPFCKFEIKFSGVNKLLISNAFLFDSDSDTKNLMEIEMRQDLFVEDLLEILFVETDYSSSNDTVFLYDQTPVSKLLSILLLYDNTELLTRNILETVINEISSDHKIMHINRHKLLFNWLLNKYNNNFVISSFLIPLFSENDLSIGKWDKNIGLTHYDRILIGNCFANDSQIRNLAIVKIGQLIYEQNKLKSDKTSAINYEHNQIEMVYRISIELIEKGLLFKYLIHNSFKINTIKSIIIEQTSENEISPLDNLSKQIDELDALSLNENDFLIIVNFLLLDLLIIILASSDPAIENKKLCYLIVNKREYWINKDKQLIQSHTFIGDFLGKSLLILINENEEDLQKEVETFIINLLMWVSKLKKDEYRDLITKLREEISLSRIIADELFMEMKPQILFFYNLVIDEERDESLLISSIELFTEIQVKYILDMLFSDLNQEFSLVQELSSSSKIIFNTHLLNFLDKKLEDSKYKNDNVTFLSKYKSLLKLLADTQIVEIRTKAHLILNRIEN